MNLDDALNDISKIVQLTRNEVVYQKEFHSIIQKKSETIAEYLTRLRDSAVDCGFTCPYEQSHDLNNYHIMQRLRYGLFNKALQQEILQKAGELSTIKLVTDYCENFEATQRGNQELTDNGKTTYVGATEDAELTGDEIVASISNYKKEKFAEKRPIMKNTQQCYYCGYKHSQKQVCPAKGKKCTKCQKFNNFAQVCKSNNNTTGNSNKHSTNAVIISTVLLLSINKRTSTTSKLPTIEICVPDTGHS